MKFFGFLTLAVAAVFANAAQADDNAPVAVNLFAAQEAGDIDVQLIPKNAKEANVIIKNNTKKPLAIKLPEAFAGVPVLAQFGGQQGGFGGGGLGGGNQGIGGGLGGGQQGGIFNIGAEKLGKMKVPVVCLEHGKTDPNPRVKYEMKPIESLSDDPRVAAVVTMLGTGELSQQTAQAAAWHYTDDMSFEELARKIGVKHLNGSVEPFFHPSQVAGAMRLSSILNDRYGDVTTEKSLADE
jgi:hypothetical protein